MTTTATAPIHGAVMRWAREDAGLTVEEAARRIGVNSSKIDLWEEDVEDPTINQLRHAADAYQQNMAFFFVEQDLSTLQTSAPTDFRGASHSRVEPILVREVKKAEDRRESLIDLFPEPSRFPTITESTVREDPVRAAAAAREFLDVDVATQTSWRDDSRALREWIHAVEDIGALVFQMSRVNVDLAQGLSAHRDPYPIILLNGADTVRPRIFTLMHELGHLFMRQGGVCDLWVDDETERLCNRFAACLLLPADAVRERIPDGVDPVDLVGQLATQFSVSSSAVAVRLRELGLISQEQLDRQLAIAAARNRRSREEARETSAQSDGGPPFYVLQLRNLGDNYVSNVLQALDSRDITRVDASYLLEAKQGTIDKMRAEMARRGTPS